MWDRIHRQFVLPLHAMRDRSQHLRYLDYLQKTQFDPPEVIRCRQQLAVRKLLDHAYATVPYYQMLFRTIGFHPSDFQDCKQLEQLPILTKKEIRKIGHQLLSSTFERKDLIRKQTSGSTGEPVTIYVDQTSLEWKRACTLRSDEWSGWKRGQTIAKIWGNPEYRQQGWRGQLRNRFLDRTTYLDTLDLRPDTLKTFVQKVKQSKPSLLFGHAHSLYLLAKHILNHPRDSFHPNAIISTAMILPSWQRQTIEQAFGVAVTDRYGCEETSLIASQCPVHKGFHINSDSVYTEIVSDSSRGHKPGTGHLLITDLTNYAMPLIRYQVGDVVVSSETTCSCGRGMPMLSSIEGRDADYVVTPEGKWISGISLAEQVASMEADIAQIQIVQDSRHSIRFRIVPTEFKNPSDRSVLNRMKSILGPSMRMEIEYVDTIPHEPSGKYRFCISHLGQELLQAFAA